MMFRHLCSLLHAFILIEINKHVFPRNTPFSEEIDTTPKIGTLEFHSKDPKVKQKVVYGTKKLWTNTIKMSPKDRYLHFDKENLVDGELYDFGRERLYPSEVQDLDKGHNKIFHDLKEIIENDEERKNNSEMNHGLLETPNDFEIDSKTDVKVTKENRVLPEKNHFPMKLTIFLVAFSLALIILIVAGLRSLCCPPTNAGKYV